MQVGMALTPNSLARRKPGVLIPSPPPPTSQVRASPASSWRRSLHGAAALRPQAQVVVQLEGWQRPGDSTLGLTRRPRSVVATSNLSQASFRSLEPWRSSRASSLSGRPHGRPGHCTTTSHDESKPTPPLAKYGPTPASSARLRLGQTTSRSWTRQATTPTLAIPAVPPPAHRRAPRPHSGRTPRTRERTDSGRPLDTGRRTVDTWTLRRPHRTPDIGHVDTGRSHRTLDAGRGRGQGDDGTAGIR